MSETPERKLVWVASSLDDLRSFPKAVKLEIGAALAVAQKGGKSHRAKPLKRLGSGVLEVVDDHDGDTYRAVYTVRFSEGDFRAPLLPEEVDARDQNAETRDRPGQQPPQSRRGSGGS
jgi:hypothetical protein